MLKEIKRLLWEEDGQSMAEYGLLTALIALICIAAVRSLGQVLAAKFENLVQEINTP